MNLSDSENPILSIVIATYNASEFLPRTLESLSVQTLIDSPSVEVVVVDGASTDQTLKQVADYEFIRRVSSERDNGIYHAMNKGALMASGRWLQFLNAGDSFTDSSGLEEVLRALKRADSAAVPWVISGAQNLGGATGITRRIPSVPHVWWRHAYGLQPHCHQATWFRRSTFVESGSHALKFSTADDFDVILRFGLLASPIVINRTIIDYLGGGISERTSRLVPSLQHQVRADRFQLGPVGRALDKQAGQAINAWNSFRKFAGKLRSSLR
ncbi:Glycosyl transferase family 2 [Arthrobacter sp. ok909]|uniref:glycosyltransferase n=1 Tax=Arthrobacter sp. ok909 TaxID=1761746 RepID=UPI0008865BCF|nr:glycosyltransferase [Arthrobacter sp. ok909]SDP25129.1 Glycosyl transferase family 2 [Arthrobacter sp. ok909]